MARPRKFYIAYQSGEAVAIVRGSIEARKLNAFGSFKTRLAAEEHAAWWNYLAKQPGGHLHHLTVDTKGRPLH